MCFLVYNVHSWIFFKITGQNGCVPVHPVRTAKVPEEILPSTEEVVIMYKKRGEVLLAINVLELIRSYEARI